MFVIADELSLNFNDKSKSTPVVLLNTDIAWPSDRTIKFQNPPGNNLSLGEIYIQSCSQVCISPIHLRHRIIILTNVMHHIIVSLLICSCTCLVIHRRQHLSTSLTHYLPVYCTFRNVL
jgi:hypothetical protein